MCHGKVSSIEGQTTCWIVHKGVSSCEGHPYFFHTSHNLLILLSIFSYSSQPSHTAQSSHIHFINHIALPLGLHTKSTVMSTIDKSTCTLATCSVQDYGYYTYIPNTGANVVYLAIFALLGIAQLFFAIKYRVWGVFAVGLVLGCAAEAIGYVARVLESRGNGIFTKK